MTTSTGKRLQQQSKNEGVIAMHKAGTTLEAVGAHFGISRERVRQIVRAAGVGRLDGGIAVRLLKETPDKVAGLRSKNEHKEAKIRATWGMSLEDYRAHVAEHGTSSAGHTPMRKFMEHRSNARRRGIAWAFTFAEWWGVWQASGKWDQRGKRGYVMARYGDGDTPYSKDTVYICTMSENSKDGYIVTPASVRSAKASKTRSANSSGA